MKKYTVIKHSGHLRPLLKCRKHSPAARVVFIFLVFSNAHCVLSHCNTRLRVLYFLNVLRGSAKPISKYILKGWLLLQVKIIYESNHVDLPGNSSNGSFYHFWFKTFTLPSFISWDLAMFCNFCWNSYFCQFHWPLAIACNFCKSWNLTILLNMNGHHVTLQVLLDLGRGFRQYWSWYLTWEA